MHWVLAIDPGGSKCEALLVRADGAALGWGRAQRPGHSGRSLGVITAAANQAVAGAGIQSRDQVLIVSASGTSERLPGLAVPARCRVTTRDINEEVGPLAVIGSTYGVVIVAGTGAFVFGRTRAGKVLTLDGMGPTLGDYGSAYQIGYEGIRAAVRTVQHPRFATSLTKPVFDACCATLPPNKRDHYRRFLNGPMTGRKAYQMAYWQKIARLHPEAARLWDMIAFSLQPQDHSVIASLARIVDAEARAGDRIARGILREAAAGMAETIWCVAAHLDIMDAAYPLVGTGSVAVHSDLFWSELCRRVRRFAPRFRPVRLPRPPVVGIALATLAGDCRRPDPAVLRRFNQTYQHLPVTAET